MGAVLIWSCVQSACFLRKHQGGVEGIEPTVPNDMAPPFRAAPTHLTRFSLRRTPPDAYPPDTNFQMAEENPGITRVLHTSFKAAYRASLAFWAALIPQQLICFQCGRVIRLPPPPPTFAFGERCRAEALAEADSSRSTSTSCKASQDRISTQALPTTWTPGSQSTIQVR